MAAVFSVVSAAVVTKISAIATRVAKRIGDFMVELDGADGNIRSEHLYTYWGVDNCLLCKKWVKG